VYRRQSTPAVFLLLCLVVGGVVQGTLLDLVGLLLAFGLSMTVGRYEHRRSASVTADPTGSAPRLYVETLNETIDAHTSRVATLRNRVPASVMLLQVAGKAVAIGVLALDLTMLGRSIVSSLLASAVVVLILFVSVDLDRPARLHHRAIRPARGRPHGDGRPPAATGT
jgi:hypothetical protein